MATVYTYQSTNVRRTWALMSVFFVLVILVGYALAAYTGNQAMLWTAVVLSFVMNIGAYWFSDKIALSSAGAQPADERDFLELHRIIENLSITAGLPKPRVYIIDDAAPNAFACGRDAQHAAIAVTTGLLRIMERTELEGVLAHELSHIGNRDILVMTVAVVLVGVVAMLADIAMRMSFWGGNDRENKSPLVLVAAIVAMILAPIAAQLIQMAVSRRREFLADASGALLTRYPDGLASALQKIGGYQQPMRRASTATAHLFISNPFGANDGVTVSSKIAKLFSTHPPIGERVAALHDMRT